jgi:hypothetical protein
MDRQTDRQTETYYGYTPTCIHIHLLLLCLLMGVLSFEWSSLVLVRSVVLSFSLPHNTVTVKCGVRYAIQFRY